MLASSMTGFKLNFTRNVKFELGQSTDRLMDRGEWFSFCCLMILASDVPPQWKSFLSEGLKRNKYIKHKLPSSVWVRVCTFLTPDGIHINVNGQSICPHPHPDL